MLYELGESVDWRPNSKKIAVVFGDAAAHDLNYAGQNYGGDPGPDGIAKNDDDLELEVVEDLYNAGMRVLAVNSGGNYAEATFRGMSEGHLTALGTSGAYYVLGATEDLPEATVDLILKESAIIDELTLAVTEGYESW